MNILLLFQMSPEYKHLHPSDTTFFIPAFVNVLLLMILLGTNCDLFPFLLGIIIFRYLPSIIWIRQALGPTLPTSRAIIDAAYILNMGVNFVVIRCLQTSYDFRDRALFYLNCFQMVICAILFIANRFEDSTGEIDEEQSSTSTGAIEFILWVLALFSVYWK